MGSHGENRCVVCGKAENLTFVSWYKTKKGKGAWLCPVHDMAETDRYLKEGKNG